MAAKKLDPFFPSIGDIASTAEARLEVSDEQAAGYVDGQVIEGDEDREVTEIESLCMSCHEQGITRLLLTSIPFFREVVVMSFKCEHCGERNTEIQSAGMIQEKGSIYTAHIRSREDFDRQLVKSPTCTITIPEFALTIPPNRGQLTNVEGIVRDTMRDLALDQPVRKVMDPENAAKIEELVLKLKDVLGDEDVQEGDMTWEGEGRLGMDTDGEDGRPDRSDVKRRKTVSREDAPSAFPVDSTPLHGRIPTPANVEVEKAFIPFTITLDDPAGNSFVQFLGSPSDPKWSFRQYSRSAAQNAELGIGGAAPDAEMPTVIQERDEMEGAQFANEEIYSFAGICSSCGSALDTLMKKVNIPYFQDIIIMSTNCDSCGYKDNEVKSGGAVSDKGKRITLKVEDAEDMSRDLLKSETCGLEIPEIDLTLQPGTLGGRFTTLEGILTQVYEELSEKVFASGGGDSAKHAGNATAPSDGEGGFETRGFDRFLMDLKAVMGGEKPFTLILDDPLANSYLQNPYAPDADPNMAMEWYERDFEQNEELGLNDMVVEGYEGQKEADAAAAAADALSSSSTAA